MFEFDKKEIIAALSAKPALLSTAFAMACARRLVNSLDRTGGGETAVDVAMGFWEAIQRDATGGTSLPAGFADQIVSMIPDEEDEPDLAAGLWDDTLAALAFAAGAFSDSLVESACSAAARAVDTAYRYSLSTVNETAITDSMFRLLMEGPLVQTELERQCRDLEDIARASDLGQTTADRLLARSVKESVLPIALCYRDYGDSDYGDSALN